MKISNEAKIGILATITILLSIWGYKFLKGQDMLDRTLTIYADYLDAQQINKSSPVFFRGVQIGTVKEIVFRPDNGTKATLVLASNKILVFRKVQKLFCFRLVFWTEKPLIWFLTKRAKAVTVYNRAILSKVERWVHWSL